jgi:hypothetical protein
MAGFFGIFSVWLPNRTFSILAFMCYLAAAVPLWDSERRGRRRPNQPAAINAETETSKNQAQGPLMGLFGRNERILYPAFNVKILYTESEGLSAN